jgi:hypothetical protein
MSDERSEFPPQSLIANGYQPHDFAGIFPLCNWGSRGPAGAESRHAESHDASSEDEADVAQISVKS